MTCTVVSFSQLIISVLPARLQNSDLKGITDMDLDVIYITGGRMPHKHNTDVEAKCHTASIRQVINHCYSYTIKYAYRISSSMYSLR